ncbi:MAG TPA: Gfo/Idh/MocA family oxidoreductase [Rhodothermales bacterium]
MGASQPVNFGIIGAGMVAAYHRQAILQSESAGARLARVCHHDPARFDEIGARFGVPCVDEETLLSDPGVDAVCICTPSGQHAAQTIAAARAGKHVLVEKPMALSLSDAERMIRACESAGVRLGVVYQRRFDPTFQAVRRALDDEAIGTLTMGVLSMPYFRSQDYYESATWRGTWALDGGGVLMNQGIHMADLLAWFMGDPIDVSAHAGTLGHDVEVEDVVAAALRFSNGAVATIAATTTAEPGFPHRLALYGTRGGLVIEGEAVVSWQSTSGAIPPFVNADASAIQSAGTGSDPKGIAPIGHIRAVQDLVAAIREGRSPAVDGHEGKRSLGLVLAVYRAAGLVLV